MRRHRPRTDARGETMTLSPANRSSGMAGARPNTRGSSWLLERRFFLRHFFASCKQAPRSSGLGEELGESDLAELDGAGHQPAAAEGNAPAARARDLGDEALGV